MASEAHLPLREYIENVRLGIAQNDAFGQFLLKLVYRQNRSGAAGLFRRVREVHDAVIEAGGTPAEARTWTAQSVRWWRDGKPVEQKFARFEVHPRAARAMDDLLKALQGLPDALISYSAPSAPPTRQPAPPTPPGGSRFGSPPPTPPTPATPPTAQQSPFTRSPSQPPGSPFG